MSCFRLKMGNFLSNKYRVTALDFFFLISTISFSGAIMSICRPNCFKLWKGVHIWKAWFGIVDEFHQDIMCMCTELILHGGVPCMPAALCYHLNESVFKTII